MWEVTAKRRTRYNSCLALAVVPVHRASDEAFFHLLDLLWGIGVGSKLHNVYRTKACRQQQYYSGIVAVSVFARLR